MKTIDYVILSQNTSTEKQGWQAAAAYKPQWNCHVIN